MKTMKAMILVVMMTIATSASAMSYSEARDEALFLADKMAYELNLTDEQYEAAYEINLDYLLHVDNYADAYGAYWRIRNNSLAAILADWQYSIYKAANYFYRPLAWIDDVLNLRIYSRYTNPRKFYRSRPAVYVTYRGGHSPRYYTSRSWNQPARRVNHSQPALPQRVQSMPANRTNRSWNNQARQTRMNNARETRISNTRQARVNNNENRSWTMQSNRNQKTTSTRSWSIQNRQMQNNNNQARIENKNKSNSFTFGNSQRNDNDKRMLAQNNKRDNRSFRR
ncbi:MAG: hypothetical protein ACOYJF_11695 [Prevotella sp.]|jgi:hypothetical protein